MWMRPNALKLNVRLAEVRIMTDFCFNKVFIYWRVVNHIQKKKLIVFFNY